ncbi:aminodeoxychorismate synthase component I [Natroniella sulfidigena]|uniref:aminodeoxychorismate synthase component I n=1 Tax=Natroniella sulfidigena TaxID=723921 RepID=UPI00200B9C59|nr:aminodeoxychorismate synthase component I [Natroniella sulfidigena]MCK8815808.1 aminodeoxychorismate synthase component I [Natroniella sulfidigena]
MITEIKTDLDVFEIYTLFKDDDHSFILDSSLHENRLGRYSFISANPFKILKYKDSDLNPLDELRKELANYEVENETHLPFVGGAVGYLSYDLCHYIEGLPRTAVDDVKIPDLYFGLYDWVIVVDHFEDETYLATPDLDPVKEEKLMTEVLRRIELGEQEGIPAICYQQPDYPAVKIESNFARDDYLAAIEKVRDYIMAGDIYQANLTQRFKGQVEMSSYELYRDLRRISPAPFGSFLNFAEVDILSNSPERFIKVEDRVVETRPIKGTRPRGETPEEDLRLKEELYNSEKDRAELLMIVDLERNDLGRVSKTGTVKVPELFELEEYANVHHLVATVEGELKEDNDLIDLIEATFPGGSITGAPKIRSMEIIDELEPTQRNVYTGSIGYFGFDGSLDLNIAIRTIVKKNEDIYFQVGGGITWDSNPEEEYDETLDKAKSIINAVRGYYEE